MSAPSISGSTPLMPGPLMPGPLMPGPLMQAGQGPAWLEGLIEVPFEWVGLGVGLVVMGGLIYFAWRAARDRHVERSERERQQRQGPGR